MAEEGSTVKPGLWTRLKSKLSRRKPDESQEANQSLLDNQAQQQAATEDPPFPPPVGGDNP
ncbi:MAG: hypothetical protein D6814_16985 [Calditrichaeota bacterium]|nr:MAG: hypothetical protein D6814_16985 [Calditrichota bacterium]